MKDVDPEKMVEIQCLCVINCGDTIFGCRFTWRVISKILPDILMYYQFGIGTFRISNTPINDCRGDCRQGHGKIGFEKRI